MEYNLTREELNTIDGGARWFWAIIGGAVTFALGFINGYTRPGTCKVR